MSSDLTTKPAPSPLRGFKRVVLFCVGGIVALFLLGAIINAVQGTNFETYRAEAVAACRAAVGEQLKAPSTARFGGEHAAVVAENADENVGTYDVTGWVDAENSFGAPVRTEWSCFSNVVDGEASAGRVRLG